MFRNYSKHKRDEFIQEENARSKGNSDWISRSIQNKMRNITDE